MTMQVAVGPELTLSVLLEGQLALLIVVLVLSTTTILTTLFTSSVSDVTSCDEKCMVAVAGRGTDRTSAFPSHARGSVGRARGYFSRLLELTFPLFLGILKDCSGSDGLFGLSGLIQVCEETRGLETEMGLRCAIPPALVLRIVVVTVMALGGGFKIWPDAT
jgi:hypothetical protein